MFHTILTALVVPETKGQIDNKPPMLQERPPFLTVKPSRLSNWIVTVREPCDRIYHLLN